MPLLAWKSEYSVGIPDVDHEHRELFDLINDLHASLFVPESETTVMDFLGELFTKVSSHLALEEKLMRDGRYASFPAHKSDHERLLDEIRDLNGRLRRRRTRGRGPGPVRGRARALVLGALLHARRRATLVVRVTASPMSARRWASAPRRFGPARGVVGRGGRGLLLSSHATAGDRPAGFDPGVDSGVDPGVDTVVEHRGESAHRNWNPPRCARKSMTKLWRGSSPISTLRS